MFVFEPTSMMGIMVARPVVYCGIGSSLKWTTFDLLYWIFCETDYRLVLRRNLSSMKHDPLVVWKIDFASIKQETPPK